MATVLIVDGDRALCCAIMTGLTDFGHETAKAADGDAALARLSRHQADSVLLNLRIPGMDGMDVLCRIKAKPGLPAEHT